MPLYVITPTEPLPFEKIAESVLHGKTPKNPLSTKKVTLI